MRSNAKEFSDRPYRENTSSYSVDDVATTVTRRRPKNGQATSETSLLMNSDSSHDSFTENAQSKTHLRLSDGSGASGNVESCAKLSSGEILGSDDRSLRSESLTRKNYSAIKFDDPRGLEGHDDNISFVSGAEQTDRNSGSVIPTEIKLPTSSTSADSLAVANHGGVVYNTTSDSLEIEEDSCLNGKPEYSTREHSSSFMKRVDIWDKKKLSSCILNDIHNSKVGFEGMKFEIGTRNDNGDLPDDTLICEEHSQEVEKVEDLSSLSEAKATFQSHLVDESDESDVLEHDVKVCDICGDAGREDLLVTCCRCSDGAEHTYCMRERLDKVPEGDWLCEECKSTEEIDTRRQDKPGAEDRAEKDLPSGCEDTEIASVLAKLDTKASDVEENRPNKGLSCAKGSGKRQADDTEISGAAKRQALEPVIASPKATNLSRVRSLSRDVSFKNLDSEKVKATQQFYLAMRIPYDTSESARSSTTGGFLKSKSFNFSNAKSKVKLVDEVPHEHRSSKEAAAHDAKGVVRGIGKSLSFKSITSPRFNTYESKVKMLSPKFSHVQDLKGSKHTNKNVFERKNSFRSPRSSINPATLGSIISAPKGDQLASRGESVSLSSTSDSELKAVHSDCRSILAAKPLNHGPRRAADVAASTGQLQRQKPHLPSVTGTTSSSSLAEKKAIEASLKDESLSSSLTGEDEVPIARESTNISERIKGTPISHSRQTTDTGVNSVPCQKCREIGHYAETCTIDSHHSLGFDSSVPKTSREGVNKGNKLKAAIEAAMLKKPSIYRRNRIPSQTDEISVSIMNNESASQDELSSSTSTRGMNSVEVIKGKAMRNSDATLSELPNGTNVKHLMAIPGEILSANSGDGCSVVPSDGKHLNVELPSHASVAMSLLLQMSSIPVHEFIWQGSFQVHRGRKNPEMWDGFQAHLSTCASPKVIAAVSKFSRRVLLNEVPRLSAWPIQFEGSGVREDNIVLYFFAREYESYERSYKILLEKMMRGDLALRGNIDGVELLIFPSNQLPEKIQRWNMLYFLWGVFRGKSCLQQGPVPLKKFCIPPDMPDSIAAFPENGCSLGSTEKNLYMPDSGKNVVTASPTLVELPSFSSVATKNIEQQNCKPLSCSSTPAQLGLNESNVMTFALINSDTKVEKESQVSLEARTSACGSNTTVSEKVALNLSSPSDKKKASVNNSNKVPTGAKEMEFCTNKVNVAAENWTDSSHGDMKCSKNRGPDERLLGVEAALDRRMFLGVQVTREVNNWPFDSRKRTYLELAEEIPQVTYSDTSQTKLSDGANESLADGVNVSKKQKTGPFEWKNNSNASSFVRDVLASRQMGDGALSSPIKEEKRTCNTVLKEMAIPPTSSGSYNHGERFFLPVEPPHEVKGENNFFPWKGSSRSEIEDTNVTERSPTLQLALGGKLKTYGVGKTNINLDEEPSEEAELACEVKTYRVSKIDINLDEELPLEEEALGADVNLTEELPEKALGAEVKTFRVGKLDINLDEEPPEEDEEEELSL